jgi:NADPH:quinone reductase-like Zn-dependent oxidoreductase
MARITPTDPSPLRRLVLAAVLLLPVCTSGALAAEAAASDAGATMTAVRFHDYGDATQLRLERAPRPVPTATQVLVRVRAASVNPYDWKFREGRLRAFIPAKLPFTPGVDFAGVVDAVGAGVTAWRKGDEVYGFVGPDANGPYAQYVVADPANLARKPAAMSFEEAAGIPVAALTAWKAMFDLGGLDPAKAKGKRVLINGASGGVGLAAIQIAKAKGLHVTAVASARNQALMRGYEADVTLDYRAQQLQSAVKPPVDLAVDAVDLATAAASAKVVKPGGVLIAMNVTPKPPEVPACTARDGGLRCQQLPNFRPAAGTFAQVARLVADGRLRMTVGTVLPLAEAAKAQELSKQGGTPGKIILRVD